MNYLEFEKPLAEIEGKAEELRTLARRSEGMNVEKEASALDRKASDMLKDLYKNLDPWRKCQVARHPDIGDQQIDDTDDRQQRQCVRAVGGFVHVIPFEPQQTDEPAAHGGMIVDDQDAQRRQRGPSADSAP